MFAAAKRNSIVFVAAAACWLALAPGLAAQTAPGRHEANILVRAAIIALDHANVTGNYTVFRAMAGPGFQQANDPERLARIFAKLRRSRADLNPALFLNPVYERGPVVDEAGYLRVTGYFPSIPERIDFDMMFQQVNGAWLLHAIAVNVDRAPNADAAQGDETQRRETSGPRRPAPPRVTTVVEPGGFNASVRIDFAPIEMQ